MKPFLDLTTNLSGKSIKYIFVDMCRVGFMHLASNRKSSTPRKNTSSNQSHH